MIITKQKMQKIKPEQKAITTEQKAIITQAYLEHKGKMNSYACYKVSNCETAQDMVQDTFTKTLSYLATQDTLTKTLSYLAKGGRVDLMKPFLFHILNHLIIDECRKNKTSSLDALDKKRFKSNCDCDYSERIAVVLESREGALLIKYLPPKYRKVMEMKYLQGLSLKEMSNITGQKKNTVAVQAHRGLEKLKILYKQNQK